MQILKHTNTQNAKGILKDIIASDRKIEALNVLMLTIEVRA